MWDVDKLVWIHLLNAYNIMSIFFQNYELLIDVCSSNIDVDSKLRI